MKSKLLYLFMLIFNYSFAQSNLIDSFAKLKNTEERIKFLSEDRIKKLGINGCIGIKTAIEKIDDDKTLFFLCYRINDLLDLNFKERKYYTDLMLEISKRNNFKVELLVTNFKSTLNQHKENLISEQNLYYQYLNIFERIKNSNLNDYTNYGLDWILNDIGRNFYEVGDFEKSLDCLLFLEEKVKMRDIFFVLTMNLIESIYVKQKKFEDAKIYAFKIFNFTYKNKKFSDNQYWENEYWHSLSAINISYYSYKTGNKEACSNYLALGQKLLLKNSDLTNKTIGQKLLLTKVDLINLAMVIAEFDALQVVIKLQLNLGQYSEAEKLLKRTTVLKEFIDNSSTHLYFKPIEFYKNSAAFYESKSNFNEAFKYLKIVNQIEDSLNVRNDKRKLWQSEMKVKSENFNEKLKILEEDKTQGNTTRNAIILGMLLLLIITFIVYQKIKKDNKVIEKQKVYLEQTLFEKEVLLKELHHRIKNNLQIISGLFEKQIKKTDDPKVKQLIKEGQDRVFSIALVHQNLHQSESLNGVQFKNYLNLLVKNIVDTNEIEEKGIKIITNVDDFIMNFDHAISVALIVNELITNCYKHAFVNRSEGKIRIDCILKDNKVNLSVSDNGVGFSTNEGESSNKTLGMGLLKGLARQIKGLVDITSSEKGTCVQIIFDFKN